MDKKFVSAESEMSALSTFEQNETLRAGHFRTYESAVRTTEVTALIMSANIHASYKNVQKRNDRYHSEFSGPSIPVPEFRTSSTTMVKLCPEKRYLKVGPRPSRNQLPHHGDHAAPAGLHGVAAGAQC